MGSLAKIAAIVSFVCVVFVQATFAAHVVCDKLPVSQCSFSVSSSGRRCELYKNHTGSVYELKCRTSTVYAESRSGYMETEACVKACGVNRGVEGIKPEALLTPKLTTHVCAASCYEKCPNIIDYFTFLSKQDDDVGLRLISLCKQGR